MDGGGTYFACVQYIQGVPQNFCSVQPPSSMLFFTHKTLVKLKNSTKYINAVPVVREIYIVHLDAKVLILIDGALSGHNLQW